MINHASIVLGLCFDWSSWQTITNSGLCFDWSLLTNSELWYDWSSWQTITNSRLGYDWSSWQTTNSGLCFDWIGCPRDILFTIHKKTTSTSVLHIDDSKIRGHTECTARHQPNLHYTPPPSQTSHTYRTKASQQKQEMSITNLKYM